ncbi:MAG: hypothetical protein AB1861_28560 [Cyanobacteriota bacterium]
MSPERGFSCQGIDRFLRTWVKFLLKFSVCSTGSGKNELDAIALYVCRYPKKAIASFN